MSGILERALEASFNAAEADLVSRRMRADDLRIERNDIRARYEALVQARDFDGITAATKRLAAIEHEIVRLGM